NLQIRVFAKRARRACVVHCAHHRIVLLKLAAMSRQPTKIVSSEHLVSEASAELSEFEYGLIMASNAFNRWMVRCMAAAGAKDMTDGEVSVLHHGNEIRRKKNV